MEIIVFIYIIINYCYYLKTHASPSAMLATDIKGMGTHEKLLHIVVEADNAEGRMILITRKTFFNEFNVARPEAIKLKYC